ncbi:hypothetical protein [Thiobacillus sp.]|uniref:hypothetical protein n=1 Tax=Thiobacillus sp. TaxID=924 RepID=UPI0025D5C84E|nr:hypothetical protein [Thiobacillus sp.]MBT9541110.1 hypothetical protein [Thiobacillus sp.]
MQKTNSTAPSNPGSDTSLRTGSMTPADSGTQGEPASGKTHCLPTAGCNLEINIEAHGDVNIHHHCPPGMPAECGSPTGGEGCYPPPASGNTCLPPVAGRKQKSSPTRKLQALAKRTRVPSVLAASTLQLVRRHLAGKQPANALESAAFKRLDGLPAAVRSTLACALDRFDTLAPELRKKLFDPTVAQGADDAVDPDLLSRAFGNELVQRAGILSFDNADASAQERPGKIRVFEPGVEDFFTQVRICSVNNLRTSSFIPLISPGGRRPEELAHDCTTTLVNGAPQVSCQVRTANCVGDLIDGGCIAVPAIAAGDSAVLEGVNFFSVDAKVRFTARLTGTAVDVDVHVFGDVDTPVNETIDGEPRLINDCRVHDRIGVTVPADLPPAIYDMQVVVPNITGIAAFGSSLTSNSATIEVVPPATARFQITAEKLFCRKETSPASFGSDEVGLRFMAVSLLPDLSIGTPQLTSRRFGDVDSGENRDIARVIFDQQQPILAVAMSILGHEVDGEDAYNNMITSSTDIFVDLVKEQAAFVKGALAAAGIGLSQLKSIGPYGAIAVGIAIAITLIVDLIVALWAPADLIIEDPTGYSLLDLAERTGADFPLPDATSFTTEGDIDVKVKPQEKIPTQYRELREYVSDDEDSRYEIHLRFNRTV